MCGRFGMFVGIDDLARRSTLPNAGNPAAGTLRENANPQGPACRTAIDKSQTRRRSRRKLADRCTTCTVWLTLKSRRLSREQPSAKTTPCRGEAL